MRHFAYASGWKKFEPLWDFVIRAKRAGMMLPVLESILSEFGRRSARPTSVAERPIREPAQSAPLPVGPSVGPLLQIQR